jgi:hypothetical protein
MSSEPVNRKSFGTKSNKSNGSKKMNLTPRCFWKPTISSTLKRRQISAMNGDEENESLTDTIGKTSTMSKRKSPAIKRPPMKSPAKFISKWKENITAKVPSPAIRPRLQRSVKQAVEILKEKPEKNTSSRKLDYEAKPIEGIDCKFEIPENLGKKRDQKASEKGDQDSLKGSQKEFADITNQNIDALSNATPLRCITGKSSVVRSSISLLQSINGSGKSTPNITPYKMMRMNKDNGKDGTQNITHLEKKIKELEEQILQSKMIKVDDEDEEAENNEFLDGMSQIDVSSMIKPAREKRSSPSKASERSQRSQKSIKKPEIIENQVQKNEESKDYEEPDEIKELENMIGQVFSTIQKDPKLSVSIQDKIKQYENVASDLLNSVKTQCSNDPIMKSPLPRFSASSRSKKSAQKRKNKPGRRRRSNRNKK